MTPGEQLWQDAINAELAVRRIRMPSLSYADVLADVERIPGFEPYAAVDEAVDPTKTKREATSSRGQSAQRTDGDYPGVQSWDQALCDNPVTLVLLEVLTYLAVTDYCLAKGCQFGYVTIDPDTCSISALKCSCADTGGGGGIDPGFDPRRWLEEFLKDEEDWWDEFESSGGFESGGDI
jgi:hypothetical protein